VWLLREATAERRKKKRKKEKRKKKSRSTFLQGDATSVPMSLNLTADQITARTISKVGGSIEAVVWVVRFLMIFDVLADILLQVLLAYWVIYHWRLRSRTGHSSVSTTAMLWFLICEAATKCGSVVLWLTNRGGISLLVFWMAGFVGLAACTLYLAIGHGIVRDIDSPTR
jgi:hypothetical protein